MKKIDFNKDWMVSINQGDFQTISLPHDAMLVNGRDKDAKSGQSGAYFLGGVYVYKKVFLVPDEWDGKTVIFEMEGVYPSGTVLLNGKELGKCSNGYLDYRFSLKDLAAGKENTIEVTVDHRNLPDSRWYTGGGLYRQVSLLIGEKIHILPDGIKIQTISAEEGKIHIEVNHTDSQNTDLEKKITIFHQGKEVLKCSAGDCVISDAKLWSAEEPNLYECRVELTENNVVLDSEVVVFGIRKLSWSEKGFFVNGKSVLLKGGCIHHDNGILGAREYKESAYRRIYRLKKMGFNAIRSAHNPMSRTVLDACDHLGMYVMDEGWDMWYKSKKKFDYARIFEQNWRADVKAIVQKDFNHPSVIMYSIGNEVTEPKNKKGVKLGKQLIESFHEFDAGRPVTCGINITLLMLAALGIDLTKSEETSKIAEKKEIDSTAFNEMMSSRGDQMNVVSKNFIADLLSKKILDALDIAGYNYGSARYKKEGKKHPGRIIVGTETYAHKLAENWKEVEELPYLIGDFMWTCWDYLGEAGIGAWTWSDEPVSFQKPYPWILADTGAFDILGNDNAEAGHAAVIWKARKEPYIAVMPVNHPWDKAVIAMWRGSNAIPYWSYKNCEGNAAQVEVYSPGSEVELFVNGISKGREKLEDMKAVFHPEYEHGELRAVAYDREGKKISESGLKSATPDTRIQILEEEKFSEDDIFYFDIALVGSNGEIECNADTKLSVRVENGELLAFGSANPKTEEHYLDQSFTTYYGRAQAVVKKQSSDLKIVVSGEGMETIEYLSRS